MSNAKYWKPSRRTLPGSPSRPQRRQRRRNFSLGQFFRPMQVTCNSSSRSVPFYPRKSHLSQRPPCEYLNPCHQDVRGGAWPRSPPPLCLPCALRSSPRTPRHDLTQIDPQPRCLRPAHPGPAGAPPMPDASARAAHAHHGRHRQSTPGRLCDGALASGLGWRIARVRLGRGSPGIDPSDRERPVEPAGGPPEHAQPVSSAAPGGLAEAVCLTRSGPHACARAPGVCEWVVWSGG